MSKSNTLYYVIGLGIVAYLIFSKKTEDQLKENPNGEEGLPKPPYPPPPNKDEGTLIGVFNPKPTKQGVFTPNK